MHTTVWTSRTRLATCKNLGEREKPGSCDRDSLAPRRDPTTHLRVGSSHHDINLLYSTISDFESVQSIISAVLPFSGIASNKVQDGFERQEY